MESASPRSICHGRTEPIWPQGSLEEAELDQEPDRADDRDKHNQHPPAGFVTVVEALDMDDDRGDQGAKILLKRPIPASGLWLPVAMSTNPAAC
jgi:hypothetical protein